MKIAVVGSRSFNDYGYMQARLDALYITVKDSLNIELVSGGARGADELAERYAEERKVMMLVYPADWDKYGKSAGYRRNQQIVDYAEMVVAFWDGESKGTKHSIDLAVKQNKQVLIYTDWKGKNG
jgi:hypothetical protein